MFEDECRSAGRRHPTTRASSPDRPVERGRSGANGYFSIDKKKVGGNPTVRNDQGHDGSTAADDDTYNLIMRDREGC